MFKAEEISQTRTVDLVRYLMAARPSKRQNGELRQRITIEVAKHLQKRLLRSSRVNKRNESEHEEKLGAYDWVSLSWKKFVAAMCDAVHIRDQKPWKFVDVGSGLGDKVYLASLLLGGFDVKQEFHGIECNEDYVTATPYLWDAIGPNATLRYATGGGTYMATRNRKFIHKDAFDHTYEDYDVIYSYRPMDGENTRKLFQHIVDTMSAGGVFIAFAKKSDAPREMECRTIDILSRSFNYYAYRV